jgi:hypothetical protein
MGVFGIFFLLVVLGVIFTFIMQAVGLGSSNRTYHSNFNQGTNDLDPAHMNAQHSQLYMDSTTGDINLDISSLDYNSSGYDSADSGSLDNSSSGFDGGSSGGFDNSRSGGSDSDSGSNNSN